MLGTTKACLFNLVLYSQDAVRCAYLTQIAHSILERFPSRIIFIQTSKDYIGPIEITNQMIGQSACEEMTIKVAQADLSRVPFLLTPELVPDLPIYLLWGLDPTSDKIILPYLERYATRLIFDSECTSNLQKFATEMLLLMDASSVQVLDMNWASIVGWRDACAKVFDSEEMLNSLQTANLVRIVYNEPLHETRAIYLQSWLASRLGWKFLAMNADTSGRYLTYQSRKKEIKIQLIAGFGDDLPPGTITAVEVDADGLEVRILRKGNLPKTFVHITTGDRCALPVMVSLPDLTRRSVFMREIFYQSVSEQYRETLKMVAPISW